MIGAAARRLIVSPLFPWAVGFVCFLFTVGFIDSRLAVGGLYAEDFRPTFWYPWQALRAGESPYPDAANPLADGSPFPYPPLAAELTLPLAWLPYDLAFVLFAAGLLAAAALTLWALDVRRPELWVLWLLSAPVAGAIIGGNATLLVILAVALTWRWRNRPGAAAAALTAGLVLKLFVWPVWFWLVFTRRYRAAAYSAVASAVLVVGSWAVIGFDGMSTYPTLLRNTAEELGDHGLLAYALTTKVASPATASILSLGIAVAFLVAAFLRRADDRAGITFAILAALYATPILWLHYFGLLVIPAALYGGWTWAAIPLLWLGVLAKAGGPRPAWLIACFIAITAMVAARPIVEHARSRTRRRVSKRAGVSGPAYDGG